MADLPGGPSGLLARDDRGKKAARLVIRIDPRVVSLVAELRGHARQAAEELERKALDASPAASALELEKRALESAL